MAVQIGRDEDDLNPVLRKIFKTETLAGLEDGIGGLVPQSVACNGRIPRVGLGGVALERGDQIRVVAEDENKGDDGLVRPHLPVQPAEGRQKEVDPLVVEFAASRDQHDSGRWRGNPFPGTGLRRQAVSPGISARLSGRPQGRGCFRCPGRSV